MSSSSITSTATTRVTTLLDIPTSALDLVLMQHSNTGRQLGQPQMVIGVGPDYAGCWIRTSENACLLGT